MTGCLVGLLDSIPESAAEYCNVTGCLIGAGTASWEAQLVLQTDEPVEFVESVECTWHTARLPVADDIIFLEVAIFLRPDLLLLLLLL